MDFLAPPFVTLIEDTMLLSGYFANVENILWMPNPQYTIHNIYFDAFGIYIQFFITMIEDMMLLPGYVTHVKNIMDNIL